MIGIKDITPCGGVSTVVIVEESAENPGGSSAIEMRSNGTHIQYRPVGGGEWTNVIALSELVGPGGTPGAPGAVGPSVELQTTVTHIQWRVTGGSWANLIALSEITGPAGPGGGGASIINPQVIYVRTNGNDGTGEIGNPALPFATAQAAYAAGVASSQAFSLDLGAGAFSITTEQISGNFRGASGVAGSVYGTCITSLNVVSKPATVTDGNGISNNGAYLGIRSVELTLTCNGGDVDGAAASSFTAGTGGTIFLSGDATCRVTILADAGSNSSSIGGSTGGGVMLMGPMLVLAINVDGTHGEAPGTLDAFGVDLRSASGVDLSGGNAGNCAFTSSIWTALADKGGNSIW